MDESSSQHVVIGGGTAGILLTYQLIMKGCRVILIERGNIDLKASSKSDFWTYLCNDEAKAQTIHSTGQPQLYNRSIKYPSGTGLGGTSNINAMLHDIGHRDVFDRYWPKDWNSDTILHYEQILDKIVPCSKIESFGGFKEMIEAVPNLPPHQLFDHNEGRWNHRSLLKAEWITQGRLTILQSEVKHIHIEDNFALSVILSNNEHVCPSNGGEIFLCAGTFATPQIIFRSGIRSIHRISNNNNISKTVDIGENLQDHPILGTFFYVNWQRHWPSTKPLPPNCVHGAVYLNEKGDLLDPKVPSTTVPRCQLLFMDGRLAGGLVDIIVPNFPRITFYNNYIRPIIISFLQFILHLSLFQWFFGHVCCINVACLQPTSRGRLIINNAGRIDVDCQLVSSEEDQLVLRNGLTTAKAIINASKQKSFDTFVFEVLPGPLFLYASTSASFQTYLKSFLLTYFHPAGTCSMDHYNERGEKVLGVVDSNLRLKTIKNLRIADASVIPHIPSFPIAKTVMIIALIAADKIYRDQGCS